MKALGIVKWKGEDPAWMKLQSIDRKNKQENKHDDVKALNEEINHLILEKGELAQHLEKTQSLLKTRIEVESERQNMYRAEISKLQQRLSSLQQRADELTRMVDIKGNQAGRPGADNVFVSRGIQYQGDTISVFSTEDTAAQLEELERGNNYLDLFLGSVQFDQALLGARLSRQPAEMRKLLTFAIVEFYDHDSQHTVPVEGVEGNYGFEANFKVTIDEHLVYYLKTNQIKVEIYMTTNKAGGGTDVTKLGEGRIPLNDLLIKNNSLKQGISYVIGDSVAITDPSDPAQQKLAKVDYKLRLRYPMTEQTKWMQEKIQLSLGVEPDAQPLKFEAGKRRRLTLIIQKAEGLPLKAESFVYFEFLEKDYSTEHIPGPSPIWNHNKTFEVNYDESFKQYLINSLLTFTIFDDKAPISDQFDAVNDIIGECQLKLELLVNNIVVEDRLPIMDYKNPKQRTGYLYLKVMWGDDQLDYRSKEDETRKVLNWEQEITYSIASALKSRGLTLYNSYRLFDRSNRNMVSFEDFEEIVTGTLAMKIFKEELQQYYQRLSQPFTAAQFECIFRPYLSDPHDMHVPTIDELYGERQQRASQQPAENNRSFLEGSNTLQIRKSKLEEDKLKEIRVRVY